MSEPPGWSVLILTGGASRRMGEDKAALTVAGTTLLARLVRCVPADIPAVVVGPDPGVLPRAVTVTREEPHGGGPAAGIVAGLGVVATPVVVVTAVDLPFAGPALERLARLMTTADPDIDAIVPMADGHCQPLCAAYRTEALARAAAALGAPDGRSVRELLAQLSIESPLWSAEELRDVDNPGDLAAARAVAARQTAIMTPTKEDFMQEWVQAVAARLEVPGDVDIDLLLDVAKDAAHKVQRPAAPITTYLIGLAVAGGMEPQLAADRVKELAGDWPNQD